MHRALLLAALLFAVGCNDGPTDPSRTIPFAGTLAKGDAAKIGTLSMGHTGNVRATLLELKLAAADGTIGPAPGGLLVGIGSTGADPAVCIADGSFLLLEGTIVSLGLERGSYCMSFQSNLTLAEGTTLTYSLKADIRD